MEDKIKINRAIIVSCSVYTDYSLQYIIVYKIDNFVLETLLSSLI